MCIWLLIALVHIVKFMYGFIKESIEAFEKMSPEEEERYFDRMYYAEQFEKEQEERRKRDC